MEKNQKFDSTETQLNLDGTAEEHTRFREIELDQAVAVGEFSDGHSAANSATRAPTSLPARRQITSRHGRYLYGYSIGFCLGVKMKKMF